MVSDLLIIETDSFLKSGCGWAFLILRGQGCLSFFIVEIYHLVSGCLGLCLDSRFASTSENKEAAWHTFVFLDQPVLSWYPGVSFIFRFHGLLLLYLFLFLELLQASLLSCLVGFLILIFLPFVTETWADQGEAVAERITAPIGLAHLVEAGAEFMQHQAIHNFDD